MNGLLEFVAYLRGKFAPRVIGTWLHEFGYTKDWQSDIHVAAVNAARERGPRLESELDAHGKRLADRAQMSRAPTGRAGVIR